MAFHTKGRLEVPKGQKVKQHAAFDADAFLGFAGADKTIVTYRRADVMFSQGDAADTVLYIQKGDVKLSVL